MLDAFILEGKTVEPTFLCMVALQPVVKLIPVLLELLDLDLQLLAPSSPLLFLLLQLLQTKAQKCKPVTRERDIDVRCSTLSLLSEQIFHEMG